MRRMRLLAGLLVVALALLSVPGVAVGAPRLRQDAPQGAQQQLQRRLDAVVRAGAPGAVALLRDSEGVVTAASGVADLETGRPMTADMHFRVGSVTKTFVATVALQLVEEGVLALDQPIEQVLPGLVPNGDQITLRMLLNHTSGLFNYTNDPTISQSIYGDPLTTFTPEELVAVAASHPPDFPPGTAWSYSNTGYIVAGLAIEATTGNPLQDELARRILVPLGLDGTSLPLTDPTLPAPHPEGYVPAAVLGGGITDPPVEFTEQNPSWAWAAGALISTADDLAVFYRALLGGDLLGPAALREMTTFVETGVPPVFPGFPLYGLGLMQWSRPCTAIGHGGDIPGFHTETYNDESADRQLVLWTTIDPINVRTSLAARRMLASTFCGSAALPDPPGRLPAPAGSPLLNPSLAR